MGQQAKGGMGQQAKGGMGQQAKGGMGQQAKGGMGQQAKGGMGQQAKGGMGQQAKGGMGQQAKGGMGGTGARVAQQARGPGSAGPRRDSAFGNVNAGRSAVQHSNRGRSSFAGGGGRGGGIARGGGGRGGFGGGRGGGRRSDVNLKYDIILLGYLDNGLGFYRFAYNGSQTVYVGVLAQEVRLVLPKAVVRGPDGYLRVYYDRLGLPFQTYNQWIASGAQVPSVARPH
jgi:hypothetical protein